MISQPFVDTSIFQGIWEYVDDDGQEWRVVREDWSYLYYKLCGDTYILDHNMVVNNKMRKMGLRYCHSCFLECENVF